MLVQYNLLNNPTDLQTPMSNVSINYKLDKTLVIKDLFTWATNFINESNGDTINKGETYYVGFIGYAKGNILIYTNPKDRYQSLKNKGDIYYNERIINKTNPNIFYLNGQTPNMLEARYFFVTKNTPEIVIDKKSTKPKDVQDIYPPEGDYTEISPI